MGIKFSVLIGAFLFSANVLAGGNIWICYGFDSGAPSESPSTVLNWGAVYAMEPLTISGKANLTKLNGVSVSEKISVGQSDISGYSGVIIPAKMDKSEYTYFAHFELSKDGAFIQRLRCFQK